MNSIRQSLHRQIATPDPATHENKSAEFCGWWPAVPTFGATIFRYLLMWLILMGSTLGFSSPAHAAYKALLIGNDAYDSKYGLQKLDNPCRDARSVAEVLHLQLGFSVTTDCNLNRVDLVARIKTFVRSIRTGDIALFYYSGHGVEYQGINYMVPVDTSIKLREDLPSDAVSMQWLLRQMKTSSKMLRVVLFDACRNNTLPSLQVSKSGLPQGLKEMSATSGTLIQFATRKGQVALDGWGDHSPYARALIAGLPEWRSKDVFSVFNTVAIKTEDYALESDFVQIPWTSNSSLRFNPVLGLGQIVDRCLQTKDLRPPDCDRQPPTADYRLTVRAVPADARIRVLNIVPVYHDGMVLERDADYQLEVSKPGYQTQWRWITLRQARQVEVVELEKRDDPPAYPVGHHFRDALSSGGQGPRMVVLPTGSFRRGAIQVSNEYPIRQVSIARSIAMMSHEVTFADYDRYMELTGDWPSVTVQYVQVPGSDSNQVSGSYLPEDKGWGRGTRPVIDVSWEDAQGYARWLSEQTGKRYRLPSEAEWEYAARAGTVKKYPWGNEASHSYANYGAEECCDGLAKGKDLWEYSAPVQSFPDNGWDLYDMHGNVWEWVADCYADSYEGAPVDGRARQSCNDTNNRVVRGGSWYDEPADLRSANRARFTATDRMAHVGFRLVQDLNP